METKAAKAVSGNRENMEEPRQEKSATGSARKTHSRYMG
jgi:hypothetical protein